MSRSEEIEQGVREVSPESQLEFRGWFRELVAAQWDYQLEEDVAAGRLDGLAREALMDLREGRTRPL